MQLLKERLTAIAAEDPMAEDPYSTAIMMVGATLDWGVREEQQGSMNQEEVNILEALRDTLHRYDKHAYNQTATEERE